MARKRKQFLLRIPPELYEVYVAWAADEFRSVNAQMEAVLVDSARRARRQPRPRAAATESAEAIDSQPQRT